MAWPVQFERLALRIRGALGARALLVEHIGSTSVVGLSAKPIIDIVLAASDSSDEPSHEHRLLKHRNPPCNPHVFTAGSPEIQRHLTFRDRLREHPEDGAAYESAKTELAQRPRRYMQQYAGLRVRVKGLQTNSP